MPLLFRKVRVRTFVTFILICTGIYTLLPFLLLSIYNHPTADDFSFAIRDTTLSFLESQLDVYMNWSGRFFGTAIVRINPLTYNSLNAYKAYSFILLGLFSGAVYLMVYTVTHKALSRNRMLALTAMLLTLYLLQLPSPAEGFYFFSTYATYQIPNIILLMALSLLYNFFGTTKALTKKLYLGLVSVLCVMMIGSNEMALILTFMTVLIITIINIKDKETRKYLLFLCITCTIACLVAVFAPGNYSRMSEHPDGGKLLRSVVYAGFMTGLSFYRWLLPILAASIVYIIYFGLPLAKTSKNNRIFSPYPGLIISYFLAVLFLMNFVFSWSTGERPTPRLENVIYFFFLFGWFYLLQVVVHKYSEHLESLRNISPLIPVFALAIFILSVLNFENSISTAYIDLISGKAKAYDAALDERYSTLTESNCKVCEVPPLPAIPKTIYFHDIIARSERESQGISKEWINRGVANFFRKDSVFLSSPNPPVLDNLSTLRSTGKSTLQ